MDKVRCYIKQLVESHNEKYYSFIHVLGQTGLAWDKVNRHLDSPSNDINLFEPYA